MRVRLGAAPAEQTEAILGVDTGAPVCVVTLRLAKKLGLSMHSPGPDDPHLYLHGRAAPIAVLPKITLSSLIETDVQCVVLGDRLDAVAGYPMDGLIGTNLLERLVTLFDFQHFRLTFYRLNSLDQPEITRLGFHDEARLGLDSDHYYLRTLLNGKLSEWMIVDTGAQYTHISRKTADTLNVKPLGLRPTSSTLSGVALERVARLASLSISGFTLQNQSVHYRTDEGDAQPTSLLGADALSHFRFLFDPANRRIFLAPSEHSRTQAVADDCEIYDAPMLSGPDGSEPALPLTLNGKIVRWFAISSAANASSILADNARDAGLKLKSLKGGELVATDSALRVLGGNRISAQFLVVPGDGGSPNAVELGGGLGPPLLSAFALRFDFGMGMLAVDRTGKSKALLSGAHDWSRIPLHLSRGRFTVTGVLDGQPIEFVLSMNQEYVTVPPALLPAKGIISATSIGGVHMRLARSHRLTVGSAAWNNPVVEWNYSTTKDSEPILGLQFLRHFVVVLDAAKRVMYLRPDPNWAKNPDPWIGTGVVLGRDTDGQLRVIGLDEHLLAKDSGLKLGDIVEKLNGIPTAGMSEERFNDEKQRPVGAEVVFGVRRPDKPDLVDFRLRSRRLV